jgi:plastocyanin
MRMVNPRLLAVTLLSITIAATGCKHSASSGNATAAPGFDPATAGTITGLVHFDGKAPDPVDIDMSMDPACSMSAGTNSSEQVVVVNKLLANVYVYVKAGAPNSSAPAGTAPVVFDQKGCRYVPHVIALQQGGTLQVKNSDPTMHNVHTAPKDGSAPIDVSQGPMAQPQTQKFDKPQTMLEVRCNNHPWMQSFINVAPNPYFAVTGADGSFTLHNLPPGTYTVAAVHETLGEKDIQVTVPAKSTATAAFTFASK